MPKKRVDEFQLFYNAARHNEVLSEKTTVMIHLATAMAVGCYP